MVLVKNWPFFHFVILGLVGQKSVFYDILERKTPFKALKTKSSNTRKIEIFRKGLDHGFVRNWPFFHFFIFELVSHEKCLLYPRKMCLRYSKTKKSFSRL